MFRKILQWMLYLTSLSLFIWYVFFKPTDFSFKNVYVFKNPIKTHEIVTIDTTLNTETKKPVGDSLVLIDTIKQDKEVQKDSINNEKTIIDTSKPYLVLVGSFGELSNAKKMLKRVEKLGLSGTIKKIGRLHRVIIASSSSKKFAIDVKNRHNKTFGETPYVLKQ